MNLNESTQQVIETPTVENQGDNIEDTTVETPEKTQHNVFKSFDTEDDYNRTLQSERSKSKNDLLKELGITSVSEFRDLKSRLDTLSTENSRLKEDMMLRELDVNPDTKDDLLTLAKSKVKDDVSLEDVIKEMKGQDTYKSFFNKPVVQHPKIGTEKSTEKSIPTTSDYLKNRFPWLK